jgi:hypothetical protein
MAPLPQRAAEGTVDAGVEHSEARYEIRRVPLLIEHAVATEDHDFDFA